mgnify:CR=1 FL=1
MKLASNYDILRVILVNKIWHSLFPYTGSYILNIVTLFNQKKHYQRSGKRHQRLITQIRYTEILYYIRKTLTLEEVIVRVQN